MKDIERLPKEQCSGKLKLGDIEFRCAVLEDGTRVLSGKSFMRGMGIYRSGAVSTRRKESKGAQLPLYLAHKNLKPFISDKLYKVLLQPLRYVPLKVGHSVWLRCGRYDAEFTNLKGLKILPL